MAILTAPGRLRFRFSLLALLLVSFAASLAIATRYAIHEHREHQRRERIRKQFEETIGIYDPIRASAARQQ